jgi:hypothetical protein
METNRGYAGTKSDNILVGTVACTFAIPLIAALVVPGTLATALCFAIPFIGAAYLCGKTSSSAAEMVEERQTDFRHQPTGELATSALREVSGNLAGAPVASAELR